MHNLSTFFQFLRHLTTDTVQFIKICKSSNQHTQYDRDPDKADFNMRQCTRGLYRISYIAGFSLEAFANAFSVPCKFIHDSECACNTELWKSPDIKDVTYISLNYHLGGAIIVDGQLLTGATGKSGTFEHMTLVPGGHDCYCGRQGCAECYCSVNSLLGDSDNLEEFFEKISRRNRLHRKMGGLFKTSVHSDQQSAYGSGAYHYIRRTCCPLLHR